MNKTIYFKCFLFGCIGSLLGFLILSFILSFYFDVSFIKDYKCNFNNNFGACFFDKRWDSADYLSLVSSFYGTIITILIFMLGFVAGLSFLIIRASTLHAAKDDIANEVERFFETTAASEQINEALSINADSKIAFTQNTMNRLIEKLEQELEIDLTDVTVKENNEA